MCTINTQWTSVADKQTKKHAVTVGTITVATDGRSGRQIVL